MKISKKVVVGLAFKEYVFRAGKCSHGKFIYLKGNLKLGLIFQPGDNL